MTVDFVQHQKFNSLIDDNLENALPIHVDSSTLIWCTYLW